MFLVIDAIIGFMKYLEMKIKIAPEGIEALLNELAIAGIDDAVIENPVEIAEMVAALGDTEWYDAEQVSADSVKSQSDNCAIITIYCSDDEDGHKRGELVRSIVEKADSPVAKPILVETWRDDSEWKDAWKEYYHTARVSERFIVKPTWESRPNDSESDKSQSLFVIEMDPGMAFGTGTHETTSLALRLMEKYIKPGDSVLDVGTGSGILAIAAAKLGAKDILGIDIDEDAVRVANENIANNITKDNTDFRIRAIKGDLTEGIDFEADVVAANLLADLVIRLTSSVAKHMKKDAIYISSGILVEKKQQVEESLRENGFKLIESLVDGEWCAIAACR